LPGIFGYISVVMRNIVGQAPRGEHFYPRDRVINTLYRRLDAQSHVFLSAPRRVGKTSIMRFLEDKPRPGYCFVYVITESVDTAEAFYKKLLNALMESKAVSELREKSQRARNLLASVLERVKAIEIAGFKLELNAGPDASYQQAFETVLSSLETEGTTVVLMIDEFPQTVENIRERHGAAEAVRFLQIQRTQRQQASAALRFIYTGSIGLPALVKKLSSAPLINDLNTVEVPPLTPEEAWDLVDRLLRYAEVPVAPGALEYLTGKIEWLIPFHLQLAAQEIIDVYESEKQEIGEAQIDRALAQIIHYRNDLYFHSYYARLKEAFPEAEQPFVFALLGRIAEEGAAARETIRQLAAQHGIADPGSVLDVLMYDGYISSGASEDAYRFNAPLLALWWKKFSLR
jgi:hypothetical protein